ncbi:MAG TPA: four helix bundle protein [Nitrospiraceae bacterium]
MSPNGTIEMADPALARIEAYHQALRFIDDAYGLTYEFTRAACGPLAAQIRQAAIATALDIAAAYETRDPGLRRRLLGTARSSCDACIAALQIAEREAYAPRGILEARLRTLRQVAASLTFLIEAEGGVPS